MSTGRPLTKLQRRALLAIAAGASYPMKMSGLTAQRISQAYSTSTFSSLLLRGLIGDADHAGRHHITDAGPDAVGIKEAP